MQDELLLTVLEAVRERTRWMKILEQTLLDMQTAVICSDVGAIEMSLQREDEVCQALMNVDRQLRPMLGEMEAAVAPGDRLADELARMGPGITGRLERAQQDHDQAQARVRELAAVQAALLRRSHRTLMAMKSVITSNYPGYQRSGEGIAGTYSPVGSRS